MYTYTKPVAQEQSEFTGYMVDEVSAIKPFDYSSIYRPKEYLEAMNYFDTSDDMTRNILLAVNEADQGTVMTSLSNKLYQHIVDKVDDIDFGTIPNSKGDITKIDNYEELTDCINIISEILQQYHQPTNSIETIQIALQNIISACIEFIKLPNDQGFEIALDKTAVNKTRDNILFQDLSKFNNMCANGSFDKAMDYVMKQNANQFTGGMFAFSASSAVVILGLLLIIIPVIRELIFFFYYTRTKVSDYFDAQSTLLTMNAYNIENNLSREDKSKKEIANKQRKVADTFKKISNAIKINNKEGEAKAAKEVSTLDKQKYKSTDVLDSVPDSANSVLF